MGTIFLLEQLSHVVVISRVSLEMFKTQLDLLQPGAGLDIWSPELPCNLSWAVVPREGSDGDEYGLDGFSVRKPRLSSENREGSGRGNEGVH